MMKNKLFKIIISCLLINNASTAQSIKTTIESFTDSLYKEQVLYGNVLVKDKGEIILQKSYGYADIENKKLHTASSLFDIGSIGKLFTSTAIMQLKEKRKLQLTDPVKKFLPTFPFDSVTIKHLFYAFVGMKRCLVLSLTTNLLR